jgi:hypothetical protein
LNSSEEDTSEPSSPEKAKKSRISARIARQKSPKLDTPATSTQRQGKKLGTAKDSDEQGDSDEHGYSDEHGSDLSNVLKPVLALVDEQYKAVVEHIIRNEKNKDTVALNLAVSLYVNLQKVTTPTLSLMCLHPLFTMS